MMTVSDILFKLSFDEVFTEYRKHYDDTHQIKVRNIFQKLKATKPSPNYSNMVLDIKAIQENEFGVDVLTDKFDCNDASILFDVFGTADDYDGVYSIAASTSEEVMGYSVSDASLEKFSPAQIIAHIIWALDW